MKTINEIPASELAKALNVATSYACHLKSGFRKVNAHQALAINEKFGIPLWEIRPDIYPRRLFPKCKNKEGSQQ